MRRGIQAGCGLLASLFLMACGSATAEIPSLSVEQHTNAVVSGCTVTPPFTSNFEPELKWEWTSSALMPQHVQVMMTPVVVDVNEDGIPDVVFNAFAGNNSSTNGIMRAIDGATGADLWAVTNPSYEVRGTASIAAGDIDFDGKVELCTIPESGNGIICFENDGTFKFRTSAGSNNYGGPSFADLDGDGNVEILDGNYVYSHTGTLKWVGSDGMGGSAGPVSFAADIDGDGKQEVINDRAIYRYDGTLKCANTRLSHGLAAVGNFDDDPAGEVVIVAAGKVSVMDDNCALLWTANLPGGGTGGAPTIADFDHDGKPEIGVAGSTRYVVFETNGLVKWTSPTQDSTSLTGASAFDFEGDGQLEVLYADETQLRIFDGATGAVRFSTPNSSGTAYEYPVVADVDGDEAAEIVVASNNFDNRPGVAGIRVFRDKKGGWVGTRRIWNQHAYSITHINDNGTLPLHPIANWRVPGLNTFRANSQGIGHSKPVAAPDLLLTDLTVECGPSPGQAALVATVLNQGDANAAAHLPVAFYEGDPATGGVLLGVATLENPLPARQSAQVKLQTMAADKVTKVFASVDDNGTGGSQEWECREDNNQLALSLDFLCDPNGNKRPVALCQPVTVPADPVTCLATASVNAGSYDPDNGPQPLSISETPAGLFGPGSHELTLTASDGSVSAVCRASVTVKDVTPPTLTLVGDPAPVVECGYALPQGVVASDTCSGELTSQIEVLNFNNRVPSFYEVKHRVKDSAGNVTVGATRWVNVVDTHPPSLELLGEAYMELECGADAYVDPGAVSYDACSGTLPVRKFNSGDDDGDGIPGALDPDDSGPGPNSSAEGTYSVQYMVTDKAWNVVSAIRTVRTRDSLPPTLTLNGPESVTVSCGADFVDPGATAVDRCYGNLSSSVMRSGALNNRIPGSYSLTYTVKDSGGHSATPVQRTVTVVDCQ